jgi:hypothetical protein
MLLHESDLLHWQQAVQNAILSPASDLKAQLAHLLRTDGASPQQRIAVYVDAYVLRLAEALRTNYPALHQLLGDNEFDRMACRYLAVHPSSHASIRWFGQHLSKFLGMEPPYANIPSIAELAEFEWALRHTIDAADAALITLDRLQAIEPESWATLTFSLHPALSILHFEWNSPQIWSALMADEQVPDPAPQSMHWLVYRQLNLLTGWRSASTLEIHALNCIDRGNSFADLCEALEHEAEDIDSIPLLAATLLKSWVEQGLVATRQSTHQKD